MSHRSTKKNMGDRQRMYPQFSGRIASTRGFARHLNRSRIRESQIFGIV